MKTFDLAEYFEVRSSAIHGQGVFSLNTMQTGDYLGRYEGPSTLENDTYVLWIENDHGEWEGCDGQNELKYLNHSDRPNAEFDGLDLYAIADIKPGDEVTFDYGEEFRDSLQDEAAL